MNLQTVLVYFLILAVKWWFCEGTTFKNGTKDIGNEMVLFYNNNADCKSFQNVNFETPSPQRKWISELFYEAQMTFRLHSDVNIKCKEDIDMFKLHLKNQSTWAVKMMESSEWPLVGIIFGTVNYMGNYDECLSISSYGIDGQYCLVNAIYNYSDVLHNEIVDIPDEKISAWEVVTMYEKNPGRVERKKLKFAMCIPSSCKPTDLKTSLDNTLQPLFNAHGLNLTINVDPIFCKTRNESARPLGYCIVRTLFMVLFFLVVCSTLYNIVTSSKVETKTEGRLSTGPNNLIKDISKIFSISENFGKFIKCDHKTENSGIHFVKVLNLMILLFGHRLIFHTYPFPLADAFLAEQHFRELTVIMARTTHVDVFFLVSGFLIFHVEFSRMLNGGMFFLFSNTLYRWTRMIVPYCIVVLFTIYILPYIGDGPIWNHHMMREVKICKETWWATALGIHNFLGNNMQCLMFSWYITADIQLFIVGEILLYIFTKNKKFGIFATLLLFLVSNVATFYIAYTKQLRSTCRLFFSNTKDLFNDSEISNLYVPSYIRCKSYLLGFMAAYVLYELKQKKIKFTNRQVYLYSFLSILFSETISAYGAKFFIFNRKYNAIESSIYSMLSPITFISQYAIIGIFYHTSGLGIFNKLVDWKFWIPLGRLSYSVVITNLPYQMYHVSSQRYPVSLSNNLNILLWVIGDWVVCYLLGLIFYLFVEAPISNVITVIKRQIYKHKTLRSNNSINESQYNKYESLKNKNE